MDPISPSGGNSCSNNNNNNNSNINTSNSDSLSSSQNKANSMANGLARNEGANSSNKHIDSGKRKNQRQKSIQSLDQSLDEWLDNCMRDTTYMTSSSEFLDKNMPSSSNNGINSTNPYRSNVSTNFPYPMRFTTGAPDLNRYFPSLQYPDYGAGQSGYSNMPHHQMLHNNHSGFTSLPPAVNMMTTVEPKMDSNELLDTLENRRYRFSDPCLAANSDNDSKESGNQYQSLHHQPANQPPKSNSSNLLSTLLQQINILHDTNAKICRNLQDTKVDIEALKHAPNWNLRHRRDSISGLSTHSQPLGGGYAFGTTSPAPTFHSGVYTPGMMTDIVREVKEAARIREEALLSRVKSMVEERSWTINDTNLKMIRDIEEMKSQVNQLKKERTETNSRMIRMEEEIKSLRLLLTHALNNSRTNNSIIPNYESERNFIRSQTTRTNETNRQNRHSLNLNYGTISNNDLKMGCSIDNTDILQPMNNDLRKMDKFKYSQTNGRHSTPYGGGGSSGSGGSYTPIENQNGINSRSFDLDHLYTTPENEQNDDHIVQMEKEKLELRRELQEALANQKNAEKKAQVLENLVKNLQSNKNADHNNSTISSRASSISESNSIISQTKPQLASQIQTISPKLMSSSISLSGPVTDL